MTFTHFRHVNDLWDDATAGRLDPLGKLGYRSKLLGADQRIANTDGNTSEGQSQSSDQVGLFFRPTWAAPGRR